MKIEVSEIKVNAIIGCHAHERNNEQEIVIDLEFDLYQYGWKAEDKLNETVDYSAIIDFVKQETAATKYNLLESLSEHLAYKILENYPKVSSVTVKLTKSAICGIKAGKISVKNTETRKFKIALALGSNLNIPRQQIVTAIELLSEFVTDIKVGGFYQTRPVSDMIQDDFVNTVISGYVTHKPELLLAKIKQIEKLMGKKEITQNGPRVIDIDIVFFADLVYQHHFLQIPHKLMHLRDFVLQPLVDIEPDWIHPVYNKTANDLLSDLTFGNRSIKNKLIV